MISGLTLGLLLSSSATSSAWAAPAAGTAATPAASESGEFSVEIPKSSLSLSSSPDGFVPRRETVLEIGASSWTPRGFERGTYLGARSSAERSSLPLLFLSAGFPLTRLPHSMEIQAVAGLGYARLLRPEQKLNLFLLRAGAELRGPSLLSAKVEPFLGAFALPAALLSPASPREGAVSATGIGFELAAGFRVFPAFLTGFLGGGQGSISLGAHLTSGDVGGSSFRGNGLFTALGVAL